MAGRVTALRGCSEGSRTHQRARFEVCVGAIDVESTKLWKEVSYAFTVLSMYM